MTTPKKQPRKLTTDQKIEKLAVQQEGLTKSVEALGEYIKHVTDLQVETFRLVREGFTDLFQVLKIEHARVNDHQPRLDDLGHDTGEK